MMARALFLDRDGVINIDHGYVHRADQVAWVPGIFDLARAAHQRGLKLIIVTNQAGIGRGFYSEDDFHALMAWIADRFARESAPLTATYFCPFHPDGIGAYQRASERRKPAPGMLLDAAHDHDIDLARSFLIGDQLTDIEAGRAAGLPARQLALFRADYSGVADGFTLVRSHDDAVMWLTAEQSPSP